jgi:NAD+--dinitrogen-reductase ADP-D-ribosyltransferase
MDQNKQNSQHATTLPAHARLPINRCNLPSVILGSLSFQQHPVPLHIDNVEELHANFFSSISSIDDAMTRADHFTAYMKSSFLLDHPEEAGFDEHADAHRRDKADYLRTLRGWLFDSDSKEAAVLKGWVESRFGLLARYHCGPLDDFSNERYQAYVHARSAGLYNTNALEAQLDLLYAYCQYELRRGFPGQSHITLYRGTNGLDEYDILEQQDRHHYTLILNNLNSFTSNRERADEFGDYILEVPVPLSKLLYFPDLLPGHLKGEDEHLVIGGVYEITMQTY